MRKIILAILAICLHVEATDKAPATITKEDILLIQDFAPTVYKTVKKVPKEKKIATAVAFLLERMAYRVDYNKLKIEAIANTGRRTARGSEEGTNTGVFPSDFNYYNVGLQATYPLLDDKEKREIQKKKIDFRMAIVDDVRKYFEAENEEHATATIVEVTELKLIRAKARATEGIIALDERITLMEKLAELNAKQATARVEKNASLEKLLSYLEEREHAEFMEILQ